MALPALVVRLPVVTPYKFYNYGTLCEGEGNSGGY